MRTVFYVFCIGNSDLIRQMFGQRTIEQRHVWYRRILLKVYSSDCPSRLVMRRT